MQRRWLWWIVVPAMLVATATPAQDYPSAPIRIVVPYAAGGIADVLARLVAIRLEPLWRQSVVVENRAGANGTIAMQYVAQARPDGHTLMIGNTGTQVVNRFLYRNLPFDIERAFQPIGLIASTPMLLVVAPAHPANSVAELLALARAQPGQLNFGSAGNGSASHLGLAMLTSMARVQIAHVPYKGTSQILPDLLGGRLSGYFDVPATSLGQIRAGTLKPLGIASPRCPMWRRSPMPSRVSSSTPGWACSRRPALRASAPTA